MPSSLPLGLTLHRSETIAHTAEGLDRKGGARASARARRRHDGHGWETKHEPTEPEKIEGLVQIATAKARQVARAAKEENMGGQHGGHSDAAKAKGRDEVSSEWLTASPEDGEEGHDQAQADAEVESSQEKLASLPHGLFGKDLPRCQGRRHATDGFMFLRRYVRESESRVQQIKTNALCGPPGDAGPRKPEGFQPLRELYPPLSPQNLERLRSSSIASSADREQARGQRRMQAPPRPSDPTPQAPQSARSSRLPNVHHAPLSHRESTMRRSPRQLPSLADFLASGGGAAMSSVGGAGQGMGSIGSQRAGAMRAGAEASNSLGDGSKLKEEQRQLRLREPAAGGGRKLPADSWRRKEKQLDKFLEEYFVEARTKRGAAGANLRDVQLFLSNDNGGADGAVEASPTDEAARNGSGASPADGNEGDGNEGEKEASPSPVVMELTHEPVRESTRGKRGDEDGGDEKLRLEAAHLAMKRLRAALYSYQGVREDRRRVLQDTLQFMEEKRPADIKRAPAMSTALVVVADPSASRQGPWYRELLSKVQADKREERPSNATYYLLECVRQVLEHGQEFRRDSFFAMLAKLEDHEITRPVAGLIAAMIQGVDGLTMREVLTWFESSRGEVPYHLKDAADAIDGPAPGGLAAPIEAMEPVVPPLLSERTPRRTLTFVTAAEAD